MGSRPVQAPDVGQRARESHRRPSRLTQTPPMSNMTALILGADMIRGNAEHIYASRSSLFKWDGLPGSIGTTGSPGDVAG